MVVHKYAVVQYGDEGWFDQFTRIAELGCLEQNVVGLPFTWLSTSVDRGRLLFINRSALAIKVGRVVEGVEDLDFVSAHHVYAAIAAPLPFSLYLVQCREFKVELAIPESLLGSYSRSLDRRNAVRDFPFFSTVPL